MASRAPPVARGRLPARSPVGARGGRGALAESLPCRLHRRAHHHPRSGDAVGLPRSLGRSGWPLPSPRLDDGDRDGAGDRHGHHEPYLAFRLGIHARAALDEKRPQPRGVSRGPKFSSCLMPGNARPRQIVPRGLAESCAGLHSFPQVRWCN